MDILSPSTLTLLSDENLRKAVDEILQGVSDSKTVTVTTKSDHSSSGGVPESTQVTVRRVA